MVRVGNPNFRGTFITCKPYFDDLMPCLWSVGKVYCNVNEGGGVELKFAGPKSQPCSGPMVSRWMSTTPLGCLRGMDVGMPLTYWGRMYEGVWLHLKLTSISWQQELQVILPARTCSRAKELFGVLRMGATRFWSSRGILNITSPIIATPFFFLKLDVK